MPTYPYSTKTSRAEGASFTAVFFSAISNGTAEMVEGYDFSSSSSSSSSSKSSQSSQSSASSISSSSSGSSQSSSSSSLSSKSSQSSQSSYPGQVTYQENDPFLGLATVTGYDSGMSSIKIKDSYLGMPVVEIGMYALAPNWFPPYLTSITVPNSVDILDDYSFLDVGAPSPPASVYFEGNAPTSVAPDAFYAASVIVYYHVQYAYDAVHNPTGFTSPTWNDMPTAVY